MSDNFLKLIPTDPRFVPPKEAQSKSLALLKGIAPAAESAEIKVSEAVEFIDPGANLLNISGPACDKQFVEWWLETMSRSSEGGFVDLSVQLPCCKRESTLNDLKYDWPAGFARFSIVLRNPGLKSLSQKQVHELEAEMGTPVRVIWAHY